MCLMEEDLILCFFGLEMEFDEVSPLEADVIKQLKDQKSCLLKEFGSVYQKLYGLNWDIR